MHCKEDFDQLLEGDNRGIEVDLDNFSVSIGLDLFVGRVLSVTSSISRPDLVHSVKSREDTLDAPEASSSEGGQSFRGLLSLLFFWGINLISDSG